MPDDKPDAHHPDTGEAAAYPRADGSDLILAALDHLRGGLPPDGSSYGTPPLGRQEEDLRQWASGVGLLLTSSDLPSKLVRGGQEHDVYHHETTDRYFKVTRNGVFGLSPGIELALVSSDQDARRFHLWEASPIDYLERLYLQNQLVPGLVRLEGIIDQPGDLAIVTSQPRFEILPATVAEIDAWFATLGFEKVTKSGYYRAEDNLAVFDAHDKNLLRFEDTLIPFDVIPCRPAGGFLQFIADTIASGHSVKALRTVSTAQTSP